jgi:hypothetical protein
MDKKMAPVASIPTDLGASISEKCRQNGGRCRFWPAMGERASGTLCPWVGSVALRALVEVQANAHDPSTKLRLPAQAVSLLVGERCVR